MGAYPPSRCGISYTCSPSKMVAERLAISYCVGESHKHIPSLRQELESWVCSFKRVRPSCFVQDRA